MVPAGTTNEQCALPPATPPRACTRFFATMTLQTTAPERIPRLVSDRRTPRFTVKRLPELGREGVANSFVAVSRRAGLFASRYFVVPLAVGHDVHRAHRLAREVDVEGDHGEPEAGRVLELALVDLERDDVPRVQYPGTSRRSVVDPVLCLRIPALEQHLAAECRDLDLGAAVAGAHVVVTIDAEQEHGVRRKPSVVRRRDRDPHPAVLRVAHLDRRDVWRAVVIVHKIRERHLSRTHVRGTTCVGRGVRGDELDVTDRLASRRDCKDAERRQAAHDFLRHGEREDAGRERRGDARRGLLRELGAVPAVRRQHACREVLNEGLVTVIAGALVGIQVEPDVDPAVGGEALVVVHGDRDREGSVGCLRERHRFQVGRLVVVAGGVRV